MTPKPPIGPLRLLRWFCREDLLEEIEGDLTELYIRNYTSAPAKAKRQFTFAVIKHLRPPFLKKTLVPNPFKQKHNYKAMWKNDVKIAGRNLVKDKQFTLLNILGLSAGLACALLIFLWVHDELGYDKIFNNDARLYKLFEQRVDGKGSQKGKGAFSYSEESSGRLSDAVKQSVAGVEYAAAVAPPGWFAQNTLSVADKNIKASGQYAGQDYFNIFSFVLLDGTPNEALAHTNAIVLSDELAIKLFGTADGLLGKPVRFDHDTTFFVSAVFKRMPANSSQQFDFVLSFDYFKTVQDWVTYWRNTGPLNYVLLKKGTDIDAFKGDVKDIINKNSSDTATKVVAMKFSDGYLHNNYNGNVENGGRLQYVQLFSLLAIFTVVIACINFMNLSTAKAARRMKEVGIRKIVGAARGQLIAQFLAESVLLTGIAMMVAIGIAALLLPAFNQITGKQIALHFTPSLLLAITAITLLTGLLAGSYPALYISRSHPLAVLKGKIKTSAAELFSRKGLVVFQFSLSTILIIAVLVIYQQIQFIQATDPGYSKDNLVRIAAEGALAKRQQAFIGALKNIPGVTTASATNHRMVGHNFSTSGLNWPDKHPDDKTQFEGFQTSYDFIETMGMHIKEGRSFSRDFGTDSLAIILNEAAVAAMQLKDPIGKSIQYGGTNRNVVGVVNNFHFESMHAAMKPSFIVLVPKGNTIIVKVNGAQQKATLAAIQHLYEQYCPGFPFTFNFLDEAYQQQYESENRVSALSKYFAGLALLISCLGLFGLTAFTAQQRRKEIGIRKVIGASTTGLAVMLSGDYLRLILLSLLIAMPIAGWLLHNWLQSFAYRISIQPFVFVLTGLAVLLLTIVTVCFQSIRAAVENPVKSLRSE